MRVFHFATSAFSYSEKRKKTSINEAECIKWPHEAAEGVLVVQKYQLGEIMHKKKVSTEELAER